MFKGFPKAKTRLKLHARAWRLPWSGWKICRSCWPFVFAFYAAPHGVVVWVSDIMLHMLHAILSSQLAEKTLWDRHHKLLIAYHLCHFLVICLLPLHQVNHPIHFFTHCTDLFAVKPKLSRSSPFSHISASQSHASASECLKGLSFTTLWRRGTTTHAPPRDPSRVHQVHQVHQGHQGHQGRGPWAPGPAAAWPFRASWQRPWHSTSSPGRHHLGCVRDIFRLVSTYIWVDVGKCVHLLASCRIGWPKIQNYSANPGCKLDFQRTQRQKVHQKTAWRVERWRWSRPERHKSWHSSSHVLPCYTAPRGYWPNKHSRVPRLDHHSVKRCQR